MTLQPATRLGSYEITSLLGSGGMGDVYKAHDERLDRDVAIKVLPSGTLADEQARKRFRKEALALSKLNHPNIATVHDFDTQEGVDFIVMEYVEGASLVEKVKTGPMPEKEIAGLGAQIADALEEAHERGIVHRDLKPGNIAVTPKGRVKVLDFGLARLVRPVSDEATTEALTEGLAVAGTLPYMAPEELRGERADHPSDLYSFGMVLYEMATGRRPFEHALSTALADAIIHKPPEPPSAQNRKVSPRLESIILKVLEKDPEHRYQSARDLLVDLKNLKRDSDSAAVVAQKARVRRGPWAYVALTLLLLALAVGGFYYFSGVAEPIDSLAVLPFENASADPTTEYLSDGITETIISNLSQLPNIRVISRNSAFHYKGKAIDAREVGRELDVDAIVLGRIVQRGEELSVSAEPVDTLDNSQIWGDRYVRELEDILSVQDEIAKAISRSLRLRLSAKDISRMTKRYTQETEAYRAYLTGRYYWNKRTEEGLKAAIQHFEEAIEKDPTYALAYSGLADSHSILGLYFLPPGETFPKARAAAMKAIEIDDTLAEAHVSLAYVTFLYYWDFSEAEKEFRRAIDLNPAYSTAYHWYSDYLFATVRHDEGLAAIRHALELDPLSLVINSITGLHLSAVGFHDQAVEQFQKTLEMDPGFPLTYFHFAVFFWRTGRYEKSIEYLQKAVEISESPLFLGLLGSAYGRAGKREEVTKVLETLQSMSKQRYVPPISFAFVQAGLGEKDRVFEWLEKAYEERVAMLAYLRTMPSFETLRDDPRFQDIVRRMNFTE